jgi:integrase
MRREDRLYKRGRTWWTVFYDSKGERHRVSTQCRDRTAALIKAAEFERAAANPKAAAQGAATVGDACKLYLDHKRNLIKRDKRSAESLEFFETKIGNVERILQRNGPLHLVNLLPKHLDEYVELREVEPGARAESTVSAHTIKKELVAFRQALELAQREGLYAAQIEPLFPKDHTAEYEPRDRALDREEVTKLVKALMPDPNDVFRKALTDGDRAARVAFLVATGARWSGSERVMRADVASDLTWVRLRETKTSAAERTVPIVTPDQKALLRFAVDNANGQKGLLFRPWDSKSRDFLSACNRAGIARCSSNDLRRTLAIWLRAGGVPAEVVGMVLGHSTARMVETVYARLARRPAELRRLLASHLEIDDENCDTFVSDGSYFGTIGAPAGLAIVSQVLAITESGRNQKSSKT